MKTIGLLTPPLLLAFNYAQNRLVTPQSEGIVMTEAPMPQKHQIKKMFLLKPQSWIECNTDASAIARHLIDSDLPSLAKVFKLQWL